MSPFNYAHHGLFDDVEELRQSLKTLQQTPSTAPILLMLKNSNQSLPHHTDTVVTYDSITHQSADQTITYDTPNQRFVLAEPGVYEVTYTVMISGDTDSSNRHAYFVCSDSPDRKYAFHSNHEPSGGHNNIRFSATDYVKTTNNSTLQIFIYQNNIDGSSQSILSGQTEELQTNCTIRKIA